MAPMDRFGSSKRAAYLWNSGDVIFEPNLVTEVCSDEGIDTVLIHWDDSFSSSVWAHFVSSLSRVGITVHALMGDPLWALASYSDDCTRRITQVIEYNLSVLPDGRFTGVCLDIEPYYNKEWRAVSTRRALLHDLLANSRVWSAMVHDADLMFSGAFPFWLDDNPEVLAAAPIGLSRPFWQELFEQYDEIQMMAYRDDPAQVAPLVRNELAYLGSQKAIIGVEITKQPEHHISYYDKGYDAYRQALQSLESQFSDYKAFGGIAIHDFEQLTSWISQK